jgi:hypothetical protein
VKITFKKLENNSAKKTWHAGIEIGGNRYDIFLEFDKISYKWTYRVWRGFVCDSEGQHWHKKDVLCDIEEFVRLRGIR